MSVLVKLLVIICVNCNPLFAQNNELTTLTVTITNVENTNGKLLVGLFNNETDFLNTPFKGIATKVSDSNSVTFSNIPKGTYAVSVMHDENDNGKMDKNFMGIPKESYGCSNAAKGFMGPPKWEDAKFKVSTENQVVTISL